MCENIVNIENQLHRSENNRCSGTHLHGKFTRRIQTEQYRTAEVAGIGVDGAGVGDDARQFRRTGAAAMRVNAAGEGDDAVNAERGTTRDNTEG